MKNSGTLKRSRCSEIPILSHVLFYDRSRLERCWLHLVDRCSLSDRVAKKICHTVAGLVNVDVVVVVI